MSNFSEFIKTFFTGCSQGAKFQQTDSGSGKSDSRHHAGKRRGWPVSNR